MSFALGDSRERYARRQVQFLVMLQMVGLGAVRIAQGVFDPGTPG
jgi:hypothetical protein